MLEFYGVGIAPAGLAMPDFEEHLRVLEKGWVFSWEELRLFANDIEQVFDCFIVAVDSVDKIRKPIEVDERRRTVLSRLRPLTVMSGLYGVTLLNC